MLTSHTALSGASKFRPAHLAASRCPALGIRNIFFHKLHPLLQTPSHGHTIFKYSTISIQYLCHFLNFSFFSHTSTVPVLLLPSFLQHFISILNSDSCRLQSYGLDGTGIESHYGQEIFSSRKPSGPILGPSSLVFIGYRRFSPGGRVAGAQN